MSLGAKEQVPVIAEGLQDQDLGVRAAAVETLGRLGAKEQALAIVERLKDEHSNVREAAVEALVSLGAKEQAPAIVERLKDRFSHVREAAVEALVSLGAKEQVPVIAEGLQDQDSGVRAAAVETLGRLGAKEQALAIVERLKDEDPGVSWAAVAALGSLGAKEQAPAIAEWLKDQDSDVRAAAVAALGNLGAKEQAPAIVERLKDEDSGVRAAAVETLGRLGAKEQASAIAERLKDENPGVRTTAVEALGKLGAKEQASAIAERLKDHEYDVRGAVVEVLVKLGPLKLAPILHLLANSYRQPDQADHVLFLAHLLGGGESTNELVISWLGRRPANIEIPVDKLTAEPDEARATLVAFKEGWDMSKDLPQLRRDLAWSIAVLVNKASWEASDVSLLEEHERNLREAGFAEADTAQRVVGGFETRNRIEIAGEIWFAHVVFWVSLILLYPRFPQVQAIFFWNPWVRRLVGLGYVGFLLTWVPPLRAILLAPFKESLLADATLGGFDPKMYFGDSPVRVKTSAQTQAITAAIPDIKGQLVLEGESGLGKTMFLRHLAQRSKRTLAYLPATKCAAGVLEAIQAKLHGYAKDETFLRSLIYSGAIDVCIDGLNEASPDARAQVAVFMESNFKGNFLLGTQPLEWTPPALARIYILEPLAREQIEAFVVSRKTTLPADARITGAKYERACRAYLAQALDDHQPGEGLAVTQRVLSNPMDLTVVASMIARDKQPDLFRLQEQQYENMADDYRRVNVGHAFPLAQFANQVYQMRTNDAEAIPEQGHKEELLCMERHKMVVRRELVDRSKQATTEWHFRHDKIMEFFIVQTFLGNGNERPVQHLGDTRFRGVYFLLAMLMPLSDAQALRERLIDYAADTKDHTVSDTFVQLLRARRPD